MLKIEPMGLFATPVSAEALMDQVAALNTPEATIAAGLTWNYLASVIAKYEANRHLNSVGGPKNQNPYANVEEEK